MLIKKLIVMATALLLSVGAYAQHEVGSVTIQPKIGMNIASMTDMDGMGFDSGSRIGLVFGAEAEYQLTDMFSLSAGLLYSAQGGTSEGLTDIDGVGTNLPIDITAQMDYLNVPIMVNCYVVKGLAVKLGIQPGFNVKGKYKAEVAGIEVKGDLEDLGLKPKTVDFSIPVGISYELYNVQIDARYNWGLTKTVSHSDSKNSVFQITLGYKFEL